MRNSSLNIYQNKIINFWIVHLITWHCPVPFKMAFIGFSWLFFHKIFARFAWALYKLFWLHGVMRFHMGFCLKACFKYLFVQKLMPFTCQFTCILLHLPSKIWILNSFSSYSWMTFFFKSFGRITRWKKNMGKWVWPIRLYE